MQQPHPIPYDSCGVALRFAGLPSAALVRLATGKRRWNHAVLACHELWHGEKGSPKCHLARHEWNIQNGWPDLLARSIEWDSTRQVTLTKTTNDDQVTDAIRKYPLKLTTLRIPNAKGITGASLPAMASIEHSRSWT